MPHGVEPIQSREDFRQFLDALIDEQLCREAASCPGRRFAPAAEWHGFVEEFCAGARGPLPTEEASSYWANAANMLLAHRDEGATLIQMMAGAIIGMGPVTILDRLPVWEHLQRVVDSPISPQLRRLQHWERLTIQTRETISIAEYQAGRRVHTTLQPEHVLLELTLSPGVASRVLGRMGILEKVRGLVSGILGPASAAVNYPDAIVPGPRLITAFEEYSWKEASLLSTFGTPAIDSAELLLGMIRGLEPSSAEALRTIGLNLEATRAEVSRYLGLAARADPPVRGRGTSSDD